MYQAAWESWFLISLLILPHGCRVEETIMQAKYPTLNAPPYPLHSSFLCLVFLLWWILISFKRTCEIYSEILFHTYFI